jgi:hypothetical protein
MTDEEYKSYVGTRYKGLVSFYDDRAQRNKRWHRVCSVFIIVVSGTLAPLISTGILLKHSMVGGFLSASIVMATALTSHFQFNENWLNYRRTWDALQREPYLRDARIGDYENASDRNAVFVERVEAVSSEEGKEWLGRHVRRQERPSGAYGGAAGKGSSADDVSRTE